MLSALHKSKTDINKKTWKIHAKYTKTKKNQQLIILIIIRNIIILKAYIPDQVTYKQLHTAKFKIIYNSNFQGRLFHKAGAAY